MVHYEEQCSTAIYTCTPDFRSGELLFLLRLLPIARKTVT